MKQKEIMAMLYACHGIAQMSTCERKKVGAVAAKNHNIISYGYNGTTPGDSNKCEDENGDTKEDCLHAEKNLLMKISKDSGAGTEGADLFLTMSPCVDCAIMIHRAGFRAVYFMEQYRCKEGTNWLIDHGIECHHILIEDVFDTARWER